MYLALDNTDLEYFNHHKKFYLDSPGLEPLEKPPIGNYSNGLEGGKRGKNGIPI